MTDFPSYTMTTVADFLAVPEDRIDACLSEFATFLRVAPHHVALLESVSDALVGEGAIKFPLVNKFQWVDDGERNFTATVELPDGTRQEVWTMSPESAPRAPGEPHA